MGFFKQLREDSRNLRVELKGQKDEAQAYVKAHASEATAYLHTTTGPVYVFPTCIIRMRKSEPAEIQPVAGVSAVVEQIGGVSARTTLTRAVTVGEGWQKANDTRETFLVVDGPEFQWQLGIDTALYAGARQFASAVTIAGRLAARRGETG